jgi:BON domain
MLRVRSKLAFAAGAVTAYFCDPQLGKARRNRFRDQARARMRHESTRAARRARYREGQLEGMQARARGAGVFPPIDDRGIADHLKQVLATLPLDTSKVAVDVNEGVVGLRGQLASPEQIQAVEERLRGEPGVVRVDNWMHVPGASAPNKAAAIYASSRSGHRLR